MKRFVITGLISTIVGLGIVCGEVDAVKTGYRIRSLGLQKREILDERRMLEYKIAKLKAPVRLERWLASKGESLSGARRIQIARVNTEDAGLSANESNAPTLIARIFLGTARADSNE